MKAGLRMTGARPVPVERSRIALLGGAAAFALLRALGRAAGAAPPLPEVTVYKSPT